MNHSKKQISLKTNIKYSAIRPTRYALRITLLALLSSLFVLLTSCQKDFSPQDTRNVQLSAESVEVTEAWLRLTTDMISKNSVYVVKRDTHIVFKGKLNKEDTLLHDTGLEPVSDYSYNLKINNHIIKTAKIQITTMDTTKVSPR